MSKTIEERLKLVEGRLKLSEDVEEITKLKSLYSRYCDGGWDSPTRDYDAVYEPDGVAELFTEDGYWDAGTWGRAVGKEAIRDLYRSFGVFPFTMHIVTNPVIEVNGDTATGDWHMIGVAKPSPEAPSFFMIGIYNDEYARTPDGWRFKSLRHTTAGTTTPFEIAWNKA
jgi:hypothetical protein